ncbi:hypothetical protein [Pontibacter roseus]|nr:hypothetical protein [Pontibacter roseus]
MLVPTERRLIRTNALKMGMIIPETDCTDMLPERYKYDSENTS